MSLPDGVGTAKCYAALLGWLNSSLTGGILLEKNSDKQPPKGQAKQKGMNTKALKRNLHPCPRASACISTAKYPTRKMKKPFKALRLLTLSCVQGLTTGQNHHSAARTQNQ